MRARRPSIEERRAEKADIDDPAIVLEAAARFLEVRPRSVAEVRGRLRRAGYRAELIQSAISRLIDLAILDDAAFARSWVESRDRARPRGEIALRRELTLKGIDRAVVDAALEERRGEPGRSGPDEAAAQRLLERHAAALGRITEPRARRKRAYALLARNGFDPEICSRVSSKVASAAD